VQDWNYGVRCYHGSAGSEKTEECYAPKQEKTLPIFRLPFDPNKPRVLSSGPLGHREAGDGAYAILTHFNAVNAVLRHFTRRWGCDVPL